MLSKSTGKWTIQGKAYSNILLTLSLSTIFLFVTFLNLIEKYHTVVTFLNLIEKYHTVVTFLNLIEKYHTVEQCGIFLLDLEMLRQCGIFLLDLEMLRQCGIFLFFILLLKYVITSYLKYFCHCWDINIGNICLARQFYLIILVQMKHRSPTNVEFYFKFKDNCSM
jgi:hypothetical protein